jgi:hypothetical protein
MTSDATGQVAEFSPVENEPPLRLLRRMRLVPKNGLGAGRRAAIAAAVTWLPIMAWAVVTGRVHAPEGSESILRHFGVHVRCLLAIPILIAGEAMLHAVLGRSSGRFVTAGLVPPERRAAFDAANESICRLRDATMPWIIILGVAIATVFLRRLDLTDDTLAWALDPDGTLGFGGWWFVHVVRPIYLGLSLAWLWRLGLVTLWFRKLAGIGLSLVPTHPDRTGGMSVVQMMPSAFVPFTLAASSVLSAAFAHRIVSHGAHVKDLGFEALTFACVWSLLLLLPLLVLTPLLAKTRRAAIPAYGALVGEQGRLTHRRWIERQPVGDEPILSAPEIGPLADAFTMYQSVLSMQSVPIGKKTIAAVLGPIAVPFLLVTSLEIPLAQLLQQVFKILM